MNETVHTSVPRELLDLDLSQVDTSFTVLSGGLYELVVKEASVEKTKDGQGDMLVLKLATLRPAKDIKGQDVKEGQMVFHRVGLQPTDKYDYVAIAKNVARVTQALRPSVSMKGEQVFNGAFASACKAFEGRTLTAKLEALPEGVDKKSGRQLPPRNEVSQLEKAK